MRRLFAILGAVSAYHSPERERREVLFAQKKNPPRNGGTWQQPEPEKRKEIIIPGQPTQSEVERMQLGMQERSKLIVPEVLTEGMETLQENARVLMGRIAQDGNDELLQASVRAAKRSQFSMATTALDRPSEWNAKDQQLALSELIKDPKGTLLLARGVEAELQRREELRYIAERRMRDVFNLPAGTVPIERFAEEVEGETVDRARVEKLLHLEPLPPESPATEQRQRDDLVHLIIEAVNAVRKQKSYGLADRRLEVPAEEERAANDAWRNEYTDRLVTNLETLKQHLSTQLQQRIQGFVDEESKRRYRLYAALPLDPAERERLTHNDPATIRAIEGKALSQWGVSIRAIEDEFEGRELAVWCIEDPSRLDGVTDAKDLLPKTQEASFLDDVEKRFDVLNEQEKNGDRFENGGKRFLAELRQDQEDAEAFAIRIAGKLQTILAMEEPDRSAITPLLRRLSAQGEDPWEKLRSIHDVIGPYATQDATSLRGNVEHCVTPVLLREHFPQESDRDAFEAALDRIAQGDVNTLATGGDALEQLERKRAEHPDLQAIIGTQISVREKIDSLLPGILPGLDSPVCKKMDLEGTLSTRISLLAQRHTRAIASAERVAGGRSKDPKREEARAKDDWAQVQVEMDQLESVRDAFATLDPKNAIYESDASFPADKHGYYTLKDRKIHLRQSLRAQGREKDLKTVWLHEKGHAVLHILRDSGVLPFFLLSEEQGWLRNLFQGGASEFEQLLRDPHLLAYYGIDALEREFAQAARERFPQDDQLQRKSVERLRREYTLEELLSHFAEQKQGQLAPVADGDPERAGKEIEHKLFALLAAQKVSQTTATTRDTFKLGGGRLFQAGPLGTGTVYAGRGIDPNTGISSEIPDATDGDSDGHRGIPPLDEGEAPASGEAPTDAPNLKQELIDTERMLKVISSFAEAYRDNPETMEFVTELTPRIAQYREQLTFFNRTLLGENPDLPDPETNPEFMKGLQEFRSNVEKDRGEVSKWDQEFLDISHRARKVRPEGFWDSIRFLSIMDVVKLYKDTIEDFKTIWGRNQQRQLQEVGNVLNDALTNGGQHIPLVGPRYFAKLRGYHERRYAGAELESVEKWKKAMEKLDSHAILDRITRTINLDEIRGCIDMLCDRGEMDWNHEGVWKTLVKKSGFNMPFEACQRDDILRDTWLRRIVSTIWNDKELYYKWRNANDTNTNSHKQKFISQVDQFSNVAGGLAGNLEKQLMLYMHWKEDAKEAHAHGQPHPPFPDEVKPHLYEQVLEYSIKNGKMTMEQKMYYLVQGLAEGLLSMERLRALAGQNGGIINFFPYIEYFYQKNNTLPEVQEIARSLKEERTSDNPNAPYKPGIKTTLWLHFNVAREEAVRARLSKGSTRIAESIDHEDIPFFVTQMDYKEMDNMADVISGSRQKVTPEGWKNAYVGFNSKFKVFANCALLEDEHLERISHADARMLTQNLGAFIHMDNILTGSVRDKLNRPGLSEHQMSTQSPSGADGTVTRNYRDAMMGFLRQLDRVGILDKVDWAGLGVTKEQLLPLSPGSFRRDVPDAIVRNYQNIFGSFVAQLQKAILSDLPNFKRALKSQESTFLNEGGSQKLTKERVKEIQREKQANIREATRRRAHTEAPEEGAGTPHDSHGA